MNETMHWVRAEGAAIEPDKSYLVKTNGGEWRDSDLMVWSGLIVEYRLRESYVRGRPIWVAEVTDPTAIETDAAWPLPAHTSQPQHRTTGQWQSIRKISGRDATHLCLSNRPVSGTTRPSSPTPKG